MLERGIETVNATDADYYIACGDITDKGTLADYEVAKEYLDKIEKPVLYVPGNRDAKNVGDLLWEEFFGSRSVTKIDRDKKVVILGLDSSEPDESTGKIGKQGIKLIYDTFQDLDDSWTKVMVFHHHTLPIYNMGRQRGTLHDAGDIIQAIISLKIDVVLHGHKHISNVYRISNGDYFSLIINSGTLSSNKTRYREKNSIAMLEVDKERKKAQLSIKEVDKPDNKWMLKFNSTLFTHQPADIVSEKYISIVHMANSEFTSDNYPVKTFRKAVNLINKMEPDIIVHCGDVTKNSMENEFETAKYELAHLKGRKMIVPGPRDYYPLGLELYEKYIGKMEDKFTDNRMQVMGFDTCTLAEKTGKLGRLNTSRIIEGSYGSSQVNVVAMHHNVIPLAKSKHSSELKDAGDVLYSLAHNDVDLILTGSKNYPGCWQVENTVIVNTGTVSSSTINTMKGNSFCVIDIYRSVTAYLYKIYEVFVSSGEKELMAEYVIPFSRSTSIDS